MEAALKETQSAAVQASAGAQVKEDELASVVRTGVQSRKVTRDVAGLTGTLPDTAPDTNAIRAPATSAMPPPGARLPIAGGGGAYGGAYDLASLGAGETPAPVLAAPSTGGARCVSAFQR